MKAIQWKLESGAQLTLTLGESPLLVFVDPDGFNTVLDVTKEDLEGISDVLSDGKYELEKVERKKREDLEEKELEKRRGELMSMFSGGAAISELFTNEASKIKAKMDADTMDMMDEAIPGKSDGDQEEKTTGSNVFPSKKGKEESDG